MKLWQDISGLAISRRHHFKQFIEQIIWKTKLYIWSESRPCEIKKDSIQNGI